jgi:hypothetical protein
MIGYVIPDSIQFHCAIVNCQAGRIVVNFAAVPADEVGRCYLCGGEEVEFDLMDSGRHSKVPHAANIRILSPREPVDIHTYREIGVIVQMGPHGDYGFLEREFHSGNPRVYLHHKNQKPGSPRMSKGQVHEYSVEPPIEGKTTWSAKDALWISKSVEVAA